MARYRISGIKVTERGPGSSSEIVTAVNWHKASDKARALGYVDFDVKLIK